MGSGGKDSALVVLQHRKPAADMGGVIVAIFQLQFEIGTEEGGAEFGDKLFLGVADIAPLLTLEGAIKP